MSLDHIQNFAEKFEQDLNSLQKLLYSTHIANNGKVAIIESISELISELSINTVRLSDFMYEFPDKSRIFIYSYKNNWVVQACH